MSTKMSLLFYFFVTILVAADVVQSNTEKKKGEKPVNLTHVFELNVEELNHTMLNNDFVVINFYTASSRASMEFQQTFMKLARKTYKENKYILFGQIDIKRFPKVQMIQHVTEVPEVFFYKKGRGLAFTGQKTVEHMTTWIHLAMNYPVAISSHQELEDLKNRATVVAGCFLGNAPKDAYETFVNVSAQFFPPKYMPLPRFALINKASISRDIGINKGTVVVYKKFEEGNKVLYTGSATDIKAMMKFVDQEAQPTVFPFGHNEYSFRLTHTACKYEHMLFMPRHDARFKQTFENFKAAAKEFMKSMEDIEVLFIYVDTTKEHVEKVVSFFHVDLAKDVPCNRITKEDKWHSRFVPEKMDFTKEGFIDFTRQVLAGKVKRNVKSEVLPGNWNKFPLKVLVGSNYEEVTRKKGVIVFVMYYVKGEKESDKNIPIIEQVAQMYRRNDTVMIATMDVSKNDGEIDVHNKYPNFKMFSADNQVKRFRGTITAAAIKDFIDSNGSIHAGYVPDTDELSSAYEFDEKEVTLPGGLDYDNEEDRLKHYELEDEKSIASAVEAIEGHMAHDDPEHMVDPEHYERLARGETTDEKDMDPAKHAEDSTDEHKHGHEEHHILHESQHGHSHEEIVSLPHGRTDHHDKENHQDHHYGHDEH